MSEYELFSIYGFHVIYPSTSKIELDPKSEWKKGDVAFRFPGGSVVFISWGPLDKAKEKYLSPEEHAKSALRTIEKSRGVKKIGLLEHRIIDVNGHMGSFNLITVTGFWKGSGLFARASEKGIRSVHVHCEASGRYFIIYGNVVGAAESIETFDRMVESFKCHSKEDSRL